MVRFALLGLGTGAIYALMTQGLILIYRGSGVLNFAHGAFAALGAFLHFELSDLHGWPTWLSILTSVAVVGALGALVHVAIMKPLAAAPPLTRVIATLGLMAVVLQASSLRYGSTIRIADTILPNTPVTPFAGATVGLDRFILLGIACATTVVLWFVYSGTRFGLATTAVAENQMIAQLTGRSPDVIAAGNWALGSALAAAAGILVAPIIPFTASNLVLLIIPALAVGLAASFSSFPIALAAAVAMGIVQSQMTRYVSTPGWSASVPFLVVILVLALRGRALPLRSHINERLPEVGRAHAVCLSVIVALVGALLIWLTPRTWTDALIITITGAIVCASLVVVTGYAGQLSLAQFAFAGFAAWVSARLAAIHGWPFPLVLVLGVCSAIPVGVVVGLPALRTRGINLAVVTFGMAFAFQNIIFQNINYTGGFSGTVVDPPSVFGLRVDALTSPKRYATVCLVLLSLVSLLVANLRNGATGRRLIAVRSNERAAAAAGISVMGAKLYAFALSAAIAGVGGVLIAFRNPHVQFAEFDVFRSVNVVIYTVIGGVGYVGGAVLAGAMFAGGLINRVVNVFASGGNVRAWVALVLAALLVPTLIAHPNGLSRLFAALAPQRRPRPPSSQQDAADGDRAALGPTPTEGRPARDPVEPKVLSVSDLTVSFGAVRALEGVSFTVAPGSVLGVMGPNGAGKTTLIDAVTGFVRPDRGSITLDGVAVQRLSATRRSRAGLSRSFQSLELFEEMSVLENLLTVSEPRAGRSYLLDLVRPVEGDLPPRAKDAIAALGLGGDLHRRPQELSYGRRRLVGIARAIANGPSVLLLDEPAAGLDDRETAELGELITGLARDWGLGVLLVEHHVPMLLAVSDEILALDFGRVVTHGPPMAVRDDPRVIASYLGLEVGSPVSPTGTGS